MKYTQNKRRIDPRYFLNELEEDWKEKERKAAEARAAASTPEAKAAYAEDREKDFLVASVLELWPTPIPPDHKVLMDMDLPQLKSYVKNLKGKKDETDKRKA